MTYAWARCLQPVRIGNGVITWIPPSDCVAGDSPREILLLGIPQLVISTSRNHAHLHVTFPLLLSDFKQNYDVSTNVSKTRTKQSKIFSLAVNLLLVYRRNHERHSTSVSSCHLLVLCKLLEDSGNCRGSLDPNEGTPRDTNTSMDILPPNISIKRQ
jgi:hypothetical protein